MVQVYRELIDKTRPVKVRCFVFALAGALSRSRRSSIVTCMGLILSPRYRVVLLSQRQVPWWGLGQNLGVNLMLSMQCGAWMPPLQKCYILPMANQWRPTVNSKSTLANYGKLSHAKQRGKKHSPASHKRMAKNSIFTFPSVKASHRLPRFPSLQINKRKMTNLLLFAKKLVFWMLENCSKPRLNSPLPFWKKAVKMMFFAKKYHFLPVGCGHFFLVLGPWPWQPAKHFLLDWPPFSLPLLQPPCSFLADLLAHYWILS